MTIDKYVPSDEDMRWHYAAKRMDDGATRTHAEQEYTRWLAAHDARVRRDAAREAMEDLASDFDLMGSQEDGPEVARWIRAVIDTEYPEETP